jgi:hypothetical protein
MLLLLVLITALLMVLPYVTERWGIFGEDWDSLEERHRNRMRGKEHLVAQDTSVLRISTLARFSRIQKHILFFGEYLLMAAWFVLLAITMVVRTEEVDGSVLLQFRPVVYVVVGVFICAIAAFASYWKVRSIEEDLEYLNRQKDWKTAS